MCSEFAALIGPSDAAHDGVPRHFRGTSAAEDVLFMGLTFLATEQETRTAVNSESSTFKDREANRRRSVIDLIRAMLMPDAQNS